MVLTETFLEFPQSLYKTAIETAVIALQRVAAAGKEEGSGGSFQRFRFVEREAPPAATSPYVSDDQNALAVLGYRSPLFVARLVAEEEGD